MMFFSFLLSLVLVLALMPVLCRAALKKGFVDHPDLRKQHETPVPPVGGLLIFPVFMVIALLFGAPFQEYWPLFVALAILLITGTWDDRRPLNAWIKFAVQFAAAFLVVMPGGVVLETLGNLFGTQPFNLGIAAIPFTVVALVLLINAVNLMDGVDGLAGGQGMIALLWLGFALVSAGNLAVLSLLMPLMGALAGFLFYNLRRPGRDHASVFLGDAGSLCLGLSMGWFCIAFAQKGLIAPISVAWILALPIMDICAQFYRRMREGRHPFSPDRGHFHHHFLDGGLSPGRASALILSLVFVLGAIGVIGPMISIPLPVLTWAWIILLLAHIAVSRRPEDYQQMIKSFRLNDVDKS